VFRRGQPAHVGEDLDPAGKRRLLHRADQPVDQGGEAVERVGIHLCPVGTRRRQHRGDLHGGLDLVGDQREFRRRRLPHRARDHHLPARRGLGRPAGSG
jgi:hypothetical protein